ncbi:MAG: CRTAC1 family protein, partial [Rhodothermaceae bacterium]|nr:CRTAC1 family protein [Rhodothermaceae bacterium]
MPLSTTRITHLPLFCLLFLSFSLSSFAQSIQFSDATDEAGIAFTHQSGTDWTGMGVGTGAAWFDFDKDNDLDLYISQGLGANQLYRNDGSGFFYEVAGPFNAQDSTHIGAAVAIADYDNDGWTDIYLANSDDDVLLKNNQGNGFVDVTEHVGLKGKMTARGTSASWGDYNNDGYLDLYVSHHNNIHTGQSDKKDKLFYNNEGKEFIDVSYLLTDRLIDGFGFIGAWSDFDNDGDLDILLVNDCGFQNNSSNFRLFQNGGGTDPLNWTFKELGFPRRFSACINGMGIAIGDYNRDGWMDYYVSNIGEKTILFRNDHAYFDNVAEEAGVLAVDPDGVDLWSWGTSFLDADLDGWQDIYLAAGVVFVHQDTEVHPQRNLFFHNNGDGTFSDQSSESGLDSPLRSRTFVTGDYDQDGDPDLLLVNNNEKVYLYRNEQQTDNNWLIVDLEGAGPPYSNKSAIGARLTLTSESGTQYWETRSGSNLGGSDDLAAYFGLGQDEAISSLEIRWPSGQTQTLTDIGINQRLSIVEPAESTTLFSDVTEQVGLTQRHRLAEGWAGMVIGTGAAWIDYDKNGYLDL